MAHFDETFIKSFKGGTFMGIWEDLKAGKDIAKTYATKRRSGIETDAFVQNKLREVLEADEKVLKTLVGRSDHTLVLTNKKIVYLSGTTVYHVIYPYETVRDVGWTDKGYGTSVFNLETTLGAKVLYGISKDDANEAIRIINDLSSGKKVEELDFQLLKSGLKDAGLLVYSVICPNCNKDLVLPESGSTVRCKSCSKEILAVDIYIRIRSVFLE